MSCTNDQFDTIKKMNPFEYSSENDCRELKNGYLTLKMGMGKTIITLEYINRHKLFPALILVPKPILIQWMSEIHNNTNNSVIEFKNTLKNKNYCKKFDILLLPYTSLIPENMLGLGIKSIIVDEAHVFRNGNRLVR